MNERATVMVLCEGQSEQKFVQHVLAPFLGVQNVDLSATQLSKPGQKGGDVRFRRSIHDIGNHLKQRKDTFVTTMIDYYGLDSQWPGYRDSLNLSTVEAKARKLIEATQEAVNERCGALRSDMRFIPYFSMHEFEALLFSSPRALARELSVDLEKIHEILRKYGTPESINTTRERIPSRQLDALVEGKFQKTSVGIQIAQTIGIPAMREKCPHFNVWISQLAALPQMRC